MIGIGGSTADLRQPYSQLAPQSGACDIAVFCLGHERVFPAFEAAAKRGMKAAVIYDVELTRFGGRFVTYVVSVSLSICIS
jgi:hypothetical protein